MYNSGASLWSSDSDPDSDSISGLEYSIGYGFPGFDPILFDFIDEDNKDAFVQRIKYGMTRSEDFCGWYQSQEMLSEIFFRISMSNAVKCATALLAGKTGLDVDINDLDSDNGSTPLLFTFYPELVNLYIREGARTDIRFEGKLPLNKALDRLRWIVLKGRAEDWSSKQSICMVIVLLCLKCLDLLESIRLLFDNTKEVAKEVYDYVKGGKLFETTALLMVAREEITSTSFFKDFTLSGSMSLHQLVLLEMESLKASQTKQDSTDEEIHEPGNKLETMNSMLCLIEVLESVGPEIDQYCQDLPKLSMEELATKVAYLLISKGFVEYEVLKRSVSGETLPTSHQHFLKLLGSKLHGEIEGSHLESKEVEGTMELADMLEENNTPLEAVETNYELQIMQLKMELEKERDKLGNAQMRLQEVHKLNEYMQEELKFLKLDKEKVADAHAELSERDSEYLVDRRIVINLLVTYFQNKHSKEILDVMVRMLGFSDEDKQRIGIAEQGTGKGGVLGLPGRLFGGILGGGSADIHANIAPDDQVKSLLNPLSIAR